MSRRRPWQVFFFRFRRDKPRSRSFLDEVTAVEWAKGYVRETGGDSMAHVHCKDQPESPDEPSERSYLVSLLDDELVVKTWEPQTEEEAHRLVRNTMDAELRGMVPLERRGVTTQLATDMGLRALPPKNP